MEARAEKQRQAKLSADAEWRKQQRQRELERNQARWQSMCRRTACRPRELSEPAL